MNNTAPPPTAQAASFDVADQRNELNNEYSSRAAEQSWMRYLPMILRSIGAIAVLISLYTFLARGWDTSTDMIRYSFFLGHTAVLALIGLASAKFIKEAKGARLLLILALVSVPINFAILGAFIFAGDGGELFAQYPAYMTWSVGSMQTALTLSAVAFLIIAPVTALGYKVLARSVYKQSSLLFLIGNIILLLPFRQPAMVALFALAAGACLIVFHLVSLRKDLTIKTAEGKIAFGLQFLPIVILLGRSFWLYSFDNILISCASMIVFIAFRQITLMMSERSGARILLEAISIGLSLICALSFGLSLMSLDLSNAIVIGLTTMVAASMVFEISLRGKLRAASYRIFATVIMVSGLMLNFLLFKDPLAALILLFVGAVMMVASYVFQQKALFIGAMILIVTGLYYQIGHLMTYFEFNYWIALASLGILSIVSGSYLEANGNRIKQWFRQSKKRLNKWEY